MPLVCFFFFFVVVCFCGGFFLRTLLLVAFGFLLGCGFSLFSPPRFLLLAGGLVRVVADRAASSSSSSNLSAGAGSLSCSFSASSASSLLDRWALRAAAAASPSFFSSFGSSPLT